MKISLDTLVVIEAIERYGSFALAAQKLYRVRSAITYTVKKLERDLNLQIFDRTEHRAKLTPAGVVLLQEGRHLLQMANTLEKTMKQIHLGWEEKITIAIDEAVSCEKIFPLIETFYNECPHVNIQLIPEILSGTWDALLTGRADLAIGATGDAPASSEYGVMPLGQIKFVFAISPHHPLAKCSEPLTNDDIVKYRAIVASDTSEQLNRRSTGTLLGQPILTVSTMRTKINAQMAGLGVGYLPEHLIKDVIANGTLVVKNVQKAKSKGQFHVAWRLQNVGNGMKWFLAKLKDPKICKYLVN